LKKKGVFILIAKFRTITLAGLLVSIIILSLPHTNIKPPENTDKPEIIQENTEKHTDPEETVVNTVPLPNQQPMSVPTQQVQRPHQPPQTNRSLQAPRPEPERQPEKKEQPLTTKTNIHTVSGLNAEEQKMLALVNAERGKCRLLPLKVPK